MIWKLGPIDIVAIDHHAGEMAQELEFAVLLEVRRAFVGSISEKFVQESTSLESFDGGRLETSHPKAIFFPG